jgi:glycosyltransferase involved in cell wall biosynthesis
MSISITSVICARNESEYLINLIPYLAEEGIEVVLLDNASEDGTKDLFNADTYPNIIERIDLPFEGKFDLSAQLAAKANVFQRLRSDWLIHQDADEILHSPNTWGGLRKCIEEVDTGGFNVLNFNELVMLPFNTKSDDYITNNRNYYFFEPRPLRLMRAWRRDANLTSAATGGHILSGEDIRVSPRRMILKHFIVKSQQHAIEKYLNRQFADRDLAKGWHGKRLGLTNEMLILPESNPYIHTLETPQSSPEKLPKSVKKHYWHW